MTRWEFFPMQLGPCAPAADVQGGWQITSYFGGRIDPITGEAGTHGGQDLAYANCDGAPIYAPSAGTMSQSWDSTGGGNWTGITLDDGSYIGIGHASAFAPGNPYRRVYAGELVAYCDSTGGSTGDHVHIAYRPAGANSYADPYDLLDDSQHRPVGDGEDEMTDDDFNRIAVMVGGIVDNRILSFSTPGVIVYDEHAQYEVVVDGDGCRVRRIIGSIGESALVRSLALVADLVQQPGKPPVDGINIRSLPQDQQDAFYRWPEVVQE